MAKKIESKNEPTSTELTKPSGTALIDTRTGERPDWLQAGDMRGTEGIGTDDIKMPRLSICQLSSPHHVEGAPEYIEGLRPGMLFNNLTREIYGKGPIDFVVVRRDPPRAMELIPIEAGGGVKDFNVPLTDPRCQWTEDENGNSVKPIATVFHDYVILLLPSLDFIALSCKSSAIPAAKVLNSLIKLRRAPIFAGRYTMTLIQEKNDKGIYWVPVFSNSQNVDAFSDRPGWVIRNIFEAAEKFYDEIKDRALNIERHDSDESGIKGADTSFNTAEM